jgi:hypothetical protein
VDRPQPRDSTHPLGAAAVCGFVFQTVSDSVISLDLTKIIAFDAYRERKTLDASTPMLVSDVGRNCKLRSQGKKSSGSA